MPFVKVVKRPHNCYLPTSLGRKRGGRGIGPGTVWECEYCKQQYMVAEKQEGEIDSYTGLRELYWRKMDKCEFIKGE